MMATISDNQTIQSKIKQIMVDKLGLNETQLTDNASFQDDLGIDSLDIIELQMTLEKEFQLTIPDEEAEKLTTVGAIIHYIQAKV